MTENGLRGWLAGIENYLVEKNLKDINPTRIFNADETAMLLNPKSE